MATQRTIISRALMWGSVVALLWAVALFAWILVLSAINSPWGYDFGLIRKARREHLSDLFILLLEAVRVSACAVLISSKWLSITVFVVNTLALWLVILYFLYVG